MASVRPFGLRNNKALLLHNLAKLQTKSLGDQGFTLIELLVVVIIIGILSAIAVPAFLNQANKAAAAKNNTIAMDNARACAAALVSGDGYTLSGGASGSCTTGGVAITATTEPTKASAAVATITPQGAVSLVTTSTAL